MVGDVAPHRSDIGFADREIGIAALPFEFREHGIIPLAGEISTHDGSLCTMNLALFEHLGWTVESSIGSVRSVDSLGSLLASFLHPNRRSAFGFLHPVGDADRARESHQDVNVIRYTTDDERWAIQPSRDAANDRMELIADQLVGQERKAILRGPDRMDEAIRERLGMVKA